MNFHVQPASIQQAAAIAALTTELVYQADANAIEQRLHRLLGRNDQLVLVAITRDQTICGWLHAQANVVLESGFRVEIVGMIVAKAMRRAGIGRKLVAEAERWAAALGAETLVVRSNLKRVESHAFYPALGYRETKTQRVYRKNLSPPQ
jgi:GNAT superfamily N-acetyltransferase